MSHMRAGQGGYVMAAAIVHTVDLMALSGRPVAQVLEHAGLTRSDLAPANGRLPVTVVERLLKSALAVTGDTQLMLKLSQVAYTTGFGVVGYLVQSCPTLQDIADNLIKFAPLLSNLGGPRIRHEPGQIVWAVDVHHDDPVFVQQTAEYLCGGSYRFLLLLDARRSEIMREVRFMHPAPASAEQRAVYADVFSCPVRFDAGENAFVLKPQAMSTRMRLPDAALKDVVAMQAEKKLGELTQPADFPAQVRREIETLVLAREASRELLAERLGVSSRHLGRLLTHAGLGYRELVDEVRMDIAQRHLREGTRSVADVAGLVGFEDGRSFSRWFRGASGMTPGEFRER